MFDKLKEKIKSFFSETDDTKQVDSTAVSLMLNQPSTYPVILTVDSLEELNKDSDNK